MANNSQSPGAQSLWPPPGSLPQNYGSSVQYRPVIPAQQGQPFAPPVLHQFRPIGQGISSSNVNYPHPMQQLSLRSGQPGHAPPSQPLPMAYAQASRPISSSSPQPLQSAPQYSNQISGVPPAPPYTFVQSFGQTQTTSVPSPLQPMSQMSASTVPAAGQPWMPSGTQGVSPMMPAQQAGQQPIAAPVPETTNVPTSNQQSLSDWQEHEAANGRRYYYNKKTKQSSWEKPMELMTPIERADASTVWKEFSTSDGRKYYYNKVTKQSVWSMPEEMKLARERALKADGEGESMEAAAGSQVPATAGGGSIEVSSAANMVTSSSSTSAVVSSSPAAVAPPVLPATNAAPTAVSDPSITAAVTSSTPVSDEVGGQAPAHGVPPVGIATSAAVSPALVNANASMSNFHNAMPQEDGVSTQDIEEAKKGMAVAGKVNVAPLEEKAQVDEPLVYANKQEAKNAFKSLLESVNVQSDWTWEQVMREIINDKRYGALKTLGERKQAFNEYLGQRKKLEAEERRMKQKKAREEFTKMLEECQELTSSVKWSKAVSMFENDERFKAVERSRDREELYDNYIVDLATKEKEKAAEEHRCNVAEFRKYLESCDFIKVNSQWRKVVDRLEDDERSSRLEKIDRLLVFQDYIRDLEKEEEEAKKIQKEQLRRSERKNRDEFRKLMDGHVSDGSLTAKTYWHDYCLKVKETPEYQAVASNTSGSTPKDLFEDVMEEQEQQYHEDKSRVKDVVKSQKISVPSTWTMDDFKAAVGEDLGDPPISDINLKLVYEDLLERAKEKEEKEARKRQRLADDFDKLLHMFKEISASSTWEECKPLFEESQEFKSVGDESFSKEIFEEYVLHLQEKAKEKERRREEEKLRKEKEREEKDKRKEKERKEKEKEREKERGKEKSRKDESDSDTGDVNDSHGYKDDKKREKDKDRKHRKRHQSVAEDVSSDKDEKDSKRSRRHGGDRKKSKKHGHSPESDSESRHKRHKRDHRDSSRRNGGYEELEDGELGEDGEIQ